MTVLPPDRCLESNRTIAANNLPCRRYLPSASVLGGFLLLALASLLMPAKVSAQADCDGAITWDGIVPQCLSPGDDYRILFVTNARQNATDATAAFYDNFARAQAASNTNLGGVMFQALISTAGESMRQHTGTATGSGERIFYYLGRKVADDYADFYDGDWDTTEQRNQRGEVLDDTMDRFSQVWTGSTSNGEIATGQTPGSTTVAYGAPATSGAELSAGQADPGMDARRIYALSATLTVPDPTLSGLEISAGSLRPMFSSTTTDYLVDVATTVENVTVTPTANNPMATITVNGDPVTSGSASGAIALVVGLNTISIVVTAADRTTTQTYILRVTRVPDVTLSDLTVVDATPTPTMPPMLPPPIPITLIRQPAGFSPTANAVDNCTRLQSATTGFAPDNADYIICVENPVQSVTITATANDPAGTNIDLNARGTDVANAPLTIGPIPSNLLAIAPLTSGGITRATITVTRNMGVAGSMAYSLSIIRIPLRPVLQTATVREDILILDYGINPGLLAASTPSPTDFTVEVERADGTEVEVMVNTVVITDSAGTPFDVMTTSRGSRVRLTLDQPVLFNDVVTLDYTQGTNPDTGTPTLVAPNNNRAVPLTNQTVTNNTPEPPSTPVFRGVTHGMPGATGLTDQLILSFSTAANTVLFFNPVESLRPSPGDFEVVNDLTGMPIPITGVNLVNPAIFPYTGSTDLTLQLGALIDITMSYTVRYTPNSMPSPTNPLRPLTSSNVDINPTTPTNDRTTAATVPPVGPFGASTDTIDPTVDSVAITTDGPYMAGEHIEVTVTFSELVPVTGTPVLTVELDSAGTVQASYNRGSDSNALVFRYTVRDRDTDTNGVSIAVNALAQAGGSTIQDPAGNDADLDHGSVAANLAHVVDTTAPTLLTATVNGNTLILTYDEPLDEASTPTTPAYTLMATPGTAPAVDTVAISGMTVTLTLVTPVAHDQTITLDYTPGSSPVQDLAGNDAAALNDRMVTNNTPPPVISIAPGPTPVVEGTTATFTVTATAASAGELAVAVMVTQTGMFIDTPPPTPTMVTIAAGTSTLMLSVQTDDDDVDEADGLITTSLDDPAPDAGYTVDSTADTATVMVQDDDTAGVTVSETAVTVDEAGGTATYTLVLTSEPTADVTITPMSGDTDIATVLPASLTFTDMNWDTAQTVTVTGVNDDIDNPGNTRTTDVTHAIAGGGYDSVDVGNVMVTATDDDTAGVTVSETAVTVAEDGGTATYTLVLTSQPTADVTITPTSGDTAIAMVGTALTFTPGNWNSAQTVTVTGVDDDLDNPGDMRTTMVSHTVMSADTGYNSQTVANVMVTATDDDSIGVTVSPTAVTVDEDGGTATYTLVLDSQPTGDVTITPTSGDTDIAMVLPASLTFTDMNWDTAQTVTVTGVNDDIDNTDDMRTTMVTHGITGGGYDSVDVDNVMVTVNDDDTATVSIEDVTVTEGNDFTFTVTLSAGVQGGLTVTPTYPNSGSTDTATSGTDYTENTTDISFTGTAGETRTFTVATADDTIAEGDETFTVGLRVSGTSITVTATDTATGTITDNDTAAVTIEDVSADEGDGITFTVTLDNAVAGGFMVTPSYTDVSTTSGTDYTENTAAITFTGTAGETQMFTVATTEDDIAEGDETFTVGLTVSGTSAMVTMSDTATGSIIDNDTAAVTVSPTAVTVDEDGGTATYTLVLNSQPTGDVTITLASDDTDVATVSTATLTFSTGDWDTAQTVTVTGVNDDIDNPGNTRTTDVTHAIAGGGYDSVDVSNVMVTATDDDGIGVTVSPTAVTVDEDGGTATYTLVLDSQPTAAVTITPTSGDTGIARALPASLTFTSSDWDSTQTVTVTGVDDEVDNDPDRTTMVTHDITSSDSGYAAETVVSVMVTATDDDTAGVTVSPTMVTVAENGGTATYTLVLDSQPTAAVTITPASGNTAIATVDAPLTFTAMNWNMEQTVTVTGVNDDIDNPGDMRTTTVTHAIAGGGYDSVDVGNVMVTATDDDGIGVTVSPTMVTVAENGGTATYTLVLGSQPTAAVTITLASDDPDVATVSTATLTFSTGDWDTAQTVTVTGVDDDVDNDPDRATMVTHTVTSSDSGYNGLDVVDVAVTATDNELPFASITADAASVIEGADAAFTVTLTSSAPAGGLPVAVRVTQTGMFINGTAPTMVTIAAGATTATLTVGTMDDDTDEENGTITATVSPGTGYTAAASPDNIASVTIEDNDAGAALAGVLTEINLRQSSVTVTVTLTDTEYVSSLVPGNFMLIENVEGDVTISMVSRTSATVATLTLAHDDTDITTDGALSVRVLASAHMGSVALDTNSLDIDIGPTLESAAINGDMLVLTYDEPLDELSTPSTADFTVMVDGESRNINDLAISGANVTLTLDSPVTGTQNVAFSYTPPARDPLQDPAGNPAAMLDNQPVENNTPSGPNPRQARQLHEEIIPQVVQAAAINFTASVEERIEKAINGGGGSLPTSGLQMDGQIINGNTDATLFGFLQKLPDYRRSLKEEGLNWKRMLANSSFALNATGKNGGGMSLWGNGYYTDFDSEVDPGSNTEVLDWNGHSFGFQIGADTKLTDHLLTGAAVSWLEGDMEYTLGSGAARQEGEYTLTLTGIHPYIGWSDDDARWSLWANTGYADGKAEIDPDEAGKQTYDTSLVSVAGGFKRKLTDSINIKGDFSIIEIDVDESDDVENDMNLSIDSQRLRLLIEALHRTELSDGGLLTRRGEIGYRVDEGDSEGDTNGVELGGRIDYQNPATGLTVAGRGRALMVSNDHREWGVSVLIRLQPETGKGLLFTLEPGYGDTAGNASDLWNQRNSYLPAERNDYNARMKAHIGYRLNAFITPYTEITTGDDARKYRMGMKWQVGNLLDLNLFGEQHEAADTENALKLEGELRF